MFFFKLLFILLQFSQFSLFSPLHPAHPPSFKFRSVLSSVMKPLVLLGREASLCVVGPHRTHYPVSRVVAVWVTGLTGGMELLVFQAAFSFVRESKLLCK